MNSSSTGSTHIRSVRIYESSQDETNRLNVEERNGGRESNGSFVSNPENRRNVQKDIAVRRAAHFARAPQQNMTTSQQSVASSTPTGFFYTRDEPLRKKSRTNGGEHDDSEHESGERITWPGPFSTARDILAKRDKARAEREARIVSMQQESGRREKNENLEEEFIDEYEEMVAKLERRNDSIELCFTRRIGHESDDEVQPGDNSKVQRLSDICATVLSEQFTTLKEEDVGIIPLEARIIIARHLAKRRLFDGPSALRLTPSSCQSIAFPDCSEIDEDTFISAVEKASGYADTLIAGEDDGAFNNTNSISHLENSLISIQLGNCGRVMCDRTAAACVNHIKHLEILELTGCYRLSDAALSKLLATCQSSLLTLQLQCNSRLSSDGLQSIRAMENLRVLNLDNANQLSERDLSNLLPSNLCKSEKEWKGLRNLNTLSLSHITSLTDELAEKLLYSYGCHLRDLSLCRCTNLTDAILLPLRSYCLHLQVLNLSFVPSLTSTGLLGLFISSSKVQDAHMQGENEDNENYNHKRDLLLQDVDLSGLRNAVDDEVLIHLCEGSSGPNLQRLNISSCSAVSSRGIAALIKNCIGHSLKDLNVSFVRGISEDIMSVLVERSQLYQNLQFLTVWGCTQLTNNFFASFQNSYIQIVGRMNA